MGKVKINTISNTKMNAICHNYYSNNCENCPLRRPKSEGDKKKGGTSDWLMCYKRCRAFYLADKTYYDEIFKLELDEKEKAYHEAQWEERIEQHMKLEENEVDLKEQDYK